MSDGPTQWINAGITGILITIAGIYIIVKISSCAMEKSDQQEVKIKQIAQEKNITEEEAEKIVVKKAGGRDWGWIAAGILMAGIAFLGFSILPGNMGIVCFLFMIGILIFVLLNLCGCPVETIDNTTDWLLTPVGK